MALVLKVSVETPTSEGTIWPVTDDTGNYDADSNPTGYGAPNPERSSLNVGLIVDKREGDDRTTPVVTPDPESATSANVAQWNLETPEDGLFDILILAAYDHDDTISHVANKVVFADGKFYKAKAIVPISTLITNATYWQEIVNVSDYPLSVSQVTTEAYATLLQKVYTYHANHAFGLTAAELSTVSCRDANQKEKIFEATIDRFYLLGAQYNEGFGFYAAGGKAIDHLTQRRNNS